MIGILIFASLGFVMCAILTGQVDKYLEEQGKEKWGGNYYCSPDWQARKR